MLNKIVRQICDGISAGLLITIGCCVYLACDVKWVGAVLFSVALLTICIKGYSLYTGRIGFVLENANKDYFSALFLGLLGNVIATAVVGIAVQYAIPNLNTVANAMCTVKLDQIWWQTLIRGIMCGVLMYVAVAVYKEKKSVIGVLFAIPVFILSGFEHSIADMGYFAIGGVYSAQAFGFIWLVILGNSVGALILPALALCGKQIKEQSSKKSVSFENSFDTVQTVDAVSAEAVFTAQSSDEIKSADTAQPVRAELSKSIESGFDSESAVFEEAACDTEEVQNEG